MIKLKRLIMNSIAGGTLYFLLKQKPSVNLETDKKSCFSSKKIWLECKT